MLEEPPNPLRCQEKILVSFWLYMSGPNLYLSCVWQSDAGFDVKTCDLYFKTLVGGKKMSVCVDIHKPKIMCMPMKVGVRTYATYANCRTRTS